MKSKTRASFATSALIAHCRLVEQLFDSTMTINIRCRTSSNPEIASIQAAEENAGDAVNACSRKAVVTPSSIVTARKAAWLIAEDTIR
jgi:hypothetical protein